MRKYPFCCTDLLFLYIAAFDCYPLESVLPLKKCPCSPRSSVNPSVYRRRLRVRDRLESIPSLRSGVIRNSHPHHTIGDLPSQPGLRLADTCGIVWFDWLRFAAILPPDPESRMLRSIHPEHCYPCSFHPRTYTEVRHISRAIGYASLAGVWSVDICVDNEE